jgi:hypothetical protein
MVRTPIAPRVLGPQQYMYDACPNGAPGASVPVPSFTRMRTPVPFAVAGCVLLLAGAPLAANAQYTAEQHEQYRHRAVFVSQPPPIDGDLSHPVWAEADPIEQFVQQVPHFGEAATERTVLRILYDSTALYIGVYCYESSPSQRAANILSYREDRIHTQDDTIRVGIDTFLDHRRAYMFGTNPLGTRQDAFFDNRSLNFDWNEVWDVETKRHADGWSAVFRIPFRILRFPPGDGEQVWGFNVMRVMQAKNETVFWAPHPPLFQLSAVEYYGHLERIVPTRQGGSLQFMPYASADARGNGGGVDLKPEFGGDLKATLGANASLDVTYNTNFAQVEADDQQTNLTRFSLFLPEKREFFLENALLFEFGIPGDTQLFFSRRIGLRGGQPVPILGGARLTGKLAATDIGLISTQTESTPETPSTNFSAARMRWNVGPRSYIGGLFTSVRSDVETNTSVGVDSLFWLGRYLSWEGFAAVVDDPSLTKRPITYSGSLDYRQDLLEYTFRTLYVDDQFGPSLGFVRRQNIRRQEADLRRSWRLNQAWSRKLDARGSVRYVTTRHGDIDTRRWNVGAGTELESGDRVSFSLERNFERLRPEAPAFVINRRDNVIIPAGDFSFDRWLLRYQGYSGRSWIADVQVQGGEFYAGDRAGLVLSGTWRANPHLLMRGDYEVHRISLPQGDFDTHLVRGRFGVPFTSKVRTDVFLQWNNLTADGSQEFSTQARFRVTYGRDSDLFIVYTDQNQDLLTGLTRRDQALQMKLTYRLYR